MTPPDPRESLQRPTAHCIKCNTPLVDLSKHPSRLVETSGGEESEEEIARQDFCPACEAEVRAGEYHSRWLAQRPAPPPPPKSETRKSQAARLREEFHRLTDLSEPSEEDRDALYLLAHLLMKVGGFRWRQTDEERGVLLFEDRSTEQTWEIQAVPLERKRLAQAQDRLNHLL